MREAFVPRSTEIKPLFWRFVYQLFTLPEYASGGHVTWSYSRFIFPMLSLTTQEKQVEISQHVATSSQYYASGVHRRLVHFSYLSYLSYVS